MKIHTLRLLAISATYFSLNPALAADIVGSTAAPAGAAVPASRITSRFESLAGSPENAASLVAGLRSGGVITLDAAIPGRGISFTPATRPMGYGNITRALSLAQRQLAALGIIEPTPQQLNLALNGGALTRIDSTGATQTVEMAGVLQLRSQGAGWGQIAHELSLSPGNHPPPAATSAGSNPTSARAAVDLRASSRGQGAIVTGDGSILHGYAPGYGIAAQSNAQDKNRGSTQASTSLHSQAARPSFTAASSSTGIDRASKGPVQARGNGRL